MTEMIERMARAICREDCAGASPELRERDWRFYLPHAIMALRALREPTRGMIEAMDLSDAEMARECWQAAIDAALKEEP